MATLLRNAVILKDSRDRDLAHKCIETLIPIFGSRETLHDDNTTPPSETVTRSGDIVVFHDNDKKREDGATYEACDMTEHHYTILVKYCSSPITKTIIQKLRDVLRHHLVNLRLSVDPLDVHDNDDDGQDVQFSMSIIILTNVAGQTRTTSVAQSTAYFTPQSSANAQQKLKESVDETLFLHQEWNPRDETSGHSSSTLSKAFDTSLVAESLDDHQLSEVPLECDKILIKALYNNIASHVYPKERASEIVDDSRLQFLDMASKCKLRLAINNNVMNDQCSGDESGESDERNDIKRLVISGFTSIRLSTIVGMIRAPVFKGRLRSFCFYPQIITIKKTIPYLPFLSRTEKHKVLGVELYFTPPRTRLALGPTQMSIADAEEQAGDQQTGNLPLQNLPHFTGIQLGKRSRSTLESTNLQVPLPFDATPQLYPAKRPCASQFVMNM